MLLDMHRLYQVQNWNLSNKVVQHKEVDILSKFLYDQLHAQWLLLLEEYPMHIWNTTVRMHSTSLASYILCVIHFFNVQCLFNFGEY